MMLLVMKRNEVTGKVLCGMSYHKYLQEEKHDLGNLSQEEIKDAAAGYCVRLSYREKSKKKFECLYRAVFSNWNMIDSPGKNLPVLCPKESAVDAKSL